jgi:hypothetical protein
MVSACVSVSNSASAPGGCPAHSASSPAAAGFAGPPAEGSPTGCLWLCEDESEFDSDRHCARMASASPLACGRIAFALPLTCAPLLQRAAAALLAESERRSFRSARAANSCTMRFCSHRPSCSFKMKHASTRCEILRQSPAPTPASRASVVSSVGSVPGAGSCHAAPSSRTYAPSSPLDIARTLLSERKSFQ